MTMSPQVERIFNKLGYFIPHYPALSGLTGNVHFSIVFSRLLYLEDLRLKSGTDFFARTDQQLANECGLGLYQCALVRDLICGPELALFTRKLHGAPPINHYLANHERIDAWLTSIGLTENPTAESPGHHLDTHRQFREKPDDESGKNRSAFAAKNQSRFQEKAASFQKKETENPDVDDDARARARIDAADKVLKDWGIENPNRSRILDHLRSREDIVSIITTVCEATAEQWARGVNNKREIIKRPAGLIISRLLNYDVDEH
jgi:hypothetical protein